MYKSRTTFQNVWRRVILHNDGIMIAPLMTALMQGGVLDFLLKNKKTTLVEVCANVVCHEGYLALALHLLCCQGWLQTSGDHYFLTGEGEEFLGYCEVYTLATSFLFQRDSLEDFFSIYSEIENEILKAHFESCLVIPFLMEYYQTKSVVPGMNRLLEVMGWRGTEEGKLALEMIPQYFYPYTYLSTLKSLKELIFGNCQLIRRGALSEDELHLDRVLDVKMSGMTFTGELKNQFLELFMPLFKDGVNKPKYLIDIGCGNGQVLKTLYEHVDSSPILIGIEYNREALEEAQKVLSPLKVDFDLFFGDVNDPLEIKKKLEKKYPDISNSVVIFKSVIHNRPFFYPQKSKIRRGLKHSVYVEESGKVIAPQDLEENFIEVMRRWKGFEAKYGYFIVEVHSIEPEVIAKNKGSSLMTLLEGTHGFSNQYLMREESYFKLLDESGFHFNKSVSLGKNIMGHDYLTISYVQ